MDFLAASEKFNLENPAKSVQVSSLRQAAREFLAEKGLPSRKIENWKYTSLKPLTENNFFTVKSPQSISAELAQLIQKNITSEFSNVVILNGEYRPELSDKLESGIVVSVSPVDSIKSVPNFSEMQGDSYLHALSGLFASSEIKVQVKDKVQLKKPVRLLFFYHSSGGPSLMTYPRTRIEIGNESQVTFLESHVGLENFRYFVNSLSEINCGKNSHVEYVFQQNQSDTAIQTAQSIFNLQSAVKLKTLSFQLGTALMRHNMDVNLNDTGSAVDLFGLSILARKQHCDNKTQINHLVGYCETKQLYKSILSGESRYIFSGKIKITHNAQKASSQQLNKNLLLSKTAEVDSEPQLEVEADDVKATHGSTVGQLNDEEIFYFKSRGISEEKALNLLSRGFAFDILYQFENQSLKKLLDIDLENAFVKLSEGLGRQAKNLETT